jgi:putative oxidoreductase
MHKWAPLLLSVLRIATGLLFLEHGTQKLFGFPPMSPAPAPGHALPELMQKLAPLSGPMELLGGVLIVLGLWTRVTAFLLSGEMAVAYFGAHAQGGFFPVLNHGELAALYCFIFLYLCAAGGGPVGLDALVRRKA